jgi:ferritin-like metal-binding protein YciE
MEAIRDRTIRYLQDLHAAEKMTLDILDKLADDAEAVSGLRLTAGEAAKECSNWMQTISARVQTLGGNLSGMKDFANSALGVLSDIFNSGHDRADKITMDAIKAHAALHLVHGSCCALKSYAGSTGDPETTAIAERHCTESKNAAERLISGIEASAVQSIAMPSVT